MNRDNRITYSEEFLNSFVDNQLSAEEKSQAYLEIGQDMALNRQVCELRKMHDLVRLAYQDATPPPASARRQPTRRHGMGVAAAILLVLGITLGMQIRPEPSAPLPAQASAPTAPVVTTASRARLPVAKPAPTSQSTVVAQTLPVSTPVLDTSAPSANSSAEHIAMESAIPPRTPIPAHGVKNRVLIHLTDDKSSQLASALDEIEGLMRYYRDTNQTAHVEVVMNGRGLDLVRVDTAPYAKRVSQLQHEYHNLTFAACQNTIDRLKREQNITVRLLPGVIIIDSGMAEIMRRQHQGWTYLQV